jgi:hypothetical protein
MFRIQHEVDNLISVVFQVEGVLSQLQVIKTRQNAAFAFVKFFEKDVGQERPKFLIFLPEKRQNLNDL